MNDKTEALKHYLGGMKKHNRAGLMQLRAIHNWHAAAQHELERRAYLVLNTFSDDLMLAIADGKVNVKQAIDEVLAG